MKAGNPCTTRPIGSMESLTQKVKTEIPIKVMVEPWRGRAVTARGMLWLTLIFLWTVGSAYSSSLVPQTALPGKCIPKYVVQLPVFGPASSIPRLDTVSHDKITVTMKEIDQAVLPVGMDSLRGEGCPGPAISFKKTRVWA